MGVYIWKKEDTRDKCKALTEHLKFCIMNPVQKVSYPPKGSYTKFTNLRKMVVAPVVAYSDFECTLEKKLDDDGTESSNDTGVVGQNDLTDIGVRQMYQEHHGISWFVKVACVNKDFALPCSALKYNIVHHPQKEPYIGEDAPEGFLDHVTDLANTYYDHYICKPAPMMFTEEDKRQFDMATECHTCQNGFPLQNIMYMTLFML